MTVRTSVACQVCHSGWYGNAGDRCPTCDRRVIVTDSFTVLDLRPALDAP